MTPPSIHKNAILNIAYSVLRLIFPIITYPYVARVIGPEGIGTASYYQAVSRYFVAFASLGLPMYGAREIARARARNEKLDVLFSELMVLSAGLAVLGTIAYGIVGFSIPALSREPLVFLMFGLTVATNFGLLDWFFRGIEDYQYIVTRNLFVRIAAVLAIFVFVRDENDYVLYAGIWVAETVIGAILNIGYASSRQSFTSVGIRPLRHWKPMVLTMGVAVTGTIYGGLDTVMLGALVQDQNRSVGYYTLALRLVRIATSILLAGVTVVMPRVARYDEEGNEEKLIRVVKLNVSYSFYVGLGFAIGLFITAPDVVYLFGGAKFSPAVSTLRILAVQVLIVSFGTIFGSQLLFARRQEKKFMLSLAIAMVFAVTLNSLLIPRWQHNGAAVGTLAARFVETSIQALLSMSIAKKVFWTHGTFRIALLASIWGVVLGFVQSALGSVPVTVRFPIIVVVGALAYFMAGWVFHIDAVVDMRAAIRKRLSR